VRVKGKFENIFGTLAKTLSVKLRMKAVIATRYGSPDVFRLVELKKPSPGDNEVLVKVSTATVTMGDCEIRRFNIPILFWLPLRLYIGVLKPRLNILGQEFSGIVEDVGKSVTRFKKGDEVFGSSDMQHGAYAEYTAAPAEYVMHKPSNITLEEAATLPLGGLNALFFLNKVNISPGQKALIIGAGGSIGVVAVQVMKSRGAEVTAVDTGDKLSMLKSIGADHVIDFTREDFTKSAIEYDYIFDIAGKSTFLPGINKLKEGGTFIMANLHPLHILQGLWLSLTTKIRVVMGGAPYRSATLKQIKDLVEEGKLKAVIDKRFPLERLQQAHDYVEKGLKIGNVVLSVV
jgi:NADPH:quinone reductase-like Zn-dependent oxidoreductase